MEHSRVRDRWLRPLGRFNPMKIVLYGAGSHVFGPSMLHQIFVEHRFRGLEVALVDRNPDAVRLLAAVGRRLSGEAGSDAEITEHVDRRSALPRADFVVCAVAVDLHRRFATDREIAGRLCPGHPVTEFGGVAGISYSLRQIAMVRELTADMNALCPQARLLNAANPLPRVVQAAAEDGIETYGFCSVSRCAYGIVWELLTGRPLRHPFDAARRRWRLTLAGTNHFCWLLAVRECASGEDLLPELRRRLDAGATTGHPLVDRVFRETGFLLACPDNHVRDFLEPDANTTGAERTSHGSAEERAARVALLQRIADGSEPVHALPHEAWERPVDLIAGVTSTVPAALHSLNVPNLGGRVVVGLPAEVYVETAAVVDDAGVHPEPVRLPDAVLPLARRAAAVTAAIVAAARTRRRALLREAVNLDPTIRDKRAGWAAIEACLAAHADLIPAME